MLKNINTRKDLEILLTELDNHTFNHDVCNSNASGTERTQLKDIKFEIQQNMQHCCIYASVVGKVYKNNKWDKSGTWIFLQRGADIEGNIEDSCLSVDDREYIVNMFNVYHNLEEFDPVDEQFHDIMLSHTLSRTISGVLDSNGAITRIRQLVENKGLWDICCSDSTQKIG